MAFIVKQDLLTQIRQLRLEQMLDSQDTTLIPQVSSEAVAVVRQYLNSLYDTEEIFAASGEYRDTLVLLWCKTVALYLLHQRLAGVMMPEHVRDMYLETLRQLERVGNGKTELDLPRKADRDVNGDGTVDENTRFRWGKRSARSHVAY
jgi:phage gp36-like protein